MSVPKSMIPYAAVMAKHIQINARLPQMGRRVSSISANAMGMMTTGRTIRAQATEIVKMMNTATFQTEIVATILRENASPFHLGRTVMALQMTKCAVVTVKSIRIPAKPINKA